MTYRHPIVAIWIVALVVTTSWFVGFIAQKHLLVEAAAVLPIFPVIGLCWLKPAEELAGWAVFTVWLGSTYLSSGTPIEYAAFAVIVGLAVIGYFLSPWFLVVAWIGHIFWDFVPRELPALVSDLPMACLIFDAIIGGFIAYRIRAGRWDLTGGNPNSP